MDFFKVNTAVFDSKGYVVGRLNAEPHSPTGGYCKLPFGGDSWNHPHNGYILCEITLFINDNTRIVQNSH